MKSKVLIVVVALGLGGIAAVLAAGYLRSARTDIAAQNQPVEVLVAQQDLPKGLSAETLMKQGMVKSEQVPAQFVAADAVSSQRAVSEQVLATPVSAGEQLTRSRFAYPAEAGLAYSVPEGYVAVSIAVDEVKGVAGLLKPGDNVAVFASFEPSGKDTAFTKTTIGSARVLAIGGKTTTESGSGEQEQGGSVLAGNRQDKGSAREGAEYETVTLAVKLPEAEHITFANEFGSIQLALLPQNAPDTPAPSAITFKEVAPKSMLR